MKRICLVIVLVIVFLMLVKAGINANNGPTAAEDQISTTVNVQASPTIPPPPLDAKQSFDLQKNESSVIEQKSVGPIFMSSIIFKDVIDFSVLDLNYTLSFRSFSIINLDYWINKEKVLFVLSKF